MKNSPKLTILFTLLLCCVCLACVNTRKVSGCVAKTVTYIYHDNTDYLYLQALHCHDTVYLIQTTPQGQILLHKLPTGKP